MFNLTPPISSLISTLQLEPHPEGGYFKQWYSSSLSLSQDLDDRWERNSIRSTSTAIWYVCPKGGKSSLHSIKSDELWFWHGGVPLMVVELQSTSSTSTSVEPIVKQTLLGPLGLPGCQSTHIVKGGTYFGAYCPTIAELLTYYEQYPSIDKSIIDQLHPNINNNNTSTTTNTLTEKDIYALVSCVVAPGKFFFRLIYKGIHVYICNTTVMLSSQIFNYTVYIFSTVLYIGFDYRDWEMKSSEELKVLYPGKEAEYIINKLAKDI